MTVGVSHLAPHLESRGTGGDTSSRRTYEESEKCFSLLFVDCQKSPDGASCCADCQLRIGCPEPRQRVVVCKMSLLLQLDHSRRERLHIRIKPSAWNVGSIPGSRSWLFCLRAKILQGPMVDTSVEKRVTACCPLGHSDEFVGCRGEAKVEKGVVGCGNRSPQINLARRPSRRRNDQSFRLLQQMVRIQRRHSRPALPRSHNR